VTAPRKPPRAITLRRTFVYDLDVYATKAPSGKLLPVFDIADHRAIIADPRDARRLRDWLNKWLEATG
jgi:hypothetical protein